MLVFIGTQNTQKIAQKTSETKHRHKYTFQTYYNNIRFDSGVDLRDCMDTLVAPVANYRSGIRALLRLTIVVPETGTTQNSLLT